MYATLATSSPQKKEPCLVPVLRGLVHVVDERSLVATAITIRTCLYRASTSRNDRESAVSTGTESSSQSGFLTYVSPAVTAAGTCVSPVVTAAGTCVSPVVTAAGTCVSPVVTAAGTCVSPAVTAAGTCLTCRDGCWDVSHLQ